jgi:hypothetical protein
MVQHLFSKFKALSSNLSAAKKIFKTVMNLQGIHFFPKWITWELVRNAETRTSPQDYNQILQFNKPSK